MKGLEALQCGVAHSQVITSTSSRHKHSLQLKPRPPTKQQRPEKCVAENEHRKRGARQNKNLAPKKKSSRLAVIVDRTVRLKQGLLCFFPTTSTTTNRTRKTPPKRFFLSDVCCTLLAPISHHCLPQHATPNAHPISSTLHTSLVPSYAVLPVLSN